MCDCEGCEEMRRTIAEMPMSQLQKEVLILSRVEKKVGEILDVLRAEIASRTN